MATKTVFFAFWPDNRQRDRMRDFIAPVTKLVDGRAVDRREWHVTLVYIGDIEERYIPELQAAAPHVVSVTGRLDGWVGRWPNMLRKRPATPRRICSSVTAGRRSKCAAALPWRSPAARAWRRSK